MSKYELRIACLVVVVFTLGAMPTMIHAGVAAGACASWCDDCWEGTIYENNCALEWQNDGRCDCGCQFNDNVDCCANCNDGRACNGLEACDGTGLCQAGTPPDCDDGLACTADECVEPCLACPVEPCTHSLLPGFCFIDGVCYTHGERNPSGSCQGCDSAVNPYVWTLVPAGSSCEPRIGRECLINGRCGEFGTCHLEPHHELCEDMNDCTEDVCRPFGCSNDPIPGCCRTDADCDDNDGCTNDACVFFDGCVNVRDDTICDDHEFCNGVERCTCPPVVFCCFLHGTLCVFGFSPNNCLMAGGVPDCSEVFCEDDTPPDCPAATPHCDEDLDKCVECLSDADCNDGIPCTADSCDTVNGQCVHAPNHSVCSDGLYCNGREKCVVSVGCRSGIPPCAASSCNEALDRCRGSTTPALRGTPKLP